MDSIPSSYIFFVDIGESTVLNPRFLKNTAQNGKFSYIFKTLGIPIVPLNALSAVSGS